MRRTPAGGRSRTIRLTTGRVIYHYLSGNQTRRLGFLQSQAPDPLNIYAFSKLCMERLAARFASRLAHPVASVVDRPSITEGAP